MTEQTTSFQVVLDALQEAKKDFPKRYLSLFSDITPLELQTLLEIWPRINLTRKLVLLNGFLNLMESDTLVSFEEIGRALLNDAEADVRSSAIRLLAEAHDAKLAGSLIEILKNDPDLEPRLEAAKLLGKFVLLAELDEFPDEVHIQTEDALLFIHNGEDHSALRRACLESLGFSSRMEVEALIRAAFNRTDRAWIVSALVAMGRNSDDQWTDQVVSMLIDVDTRIRLAAVQAAGELRIEESRTILLKLLEDEDDDEVTAAAIWSLSQIGGEDVRPYLENLIDQTEDEDVIAYLEDALENLELTEDLEKFDLLAVDEDELDEEE